MIQNEKPTLVLGHGSFHGPRVFEPLAHELSPDFHIIKANYPVDDPIANKDDFAHITADLVSDRERVILLGWSTGGDVAERAATLLDNDQLLGVVLVNSGIEISKDMEQPFGPTRPKYHASYFEKGTSVGEDGMRYMNKPMAVHNLYKSLLQQGRLREIFELFNDLRPQNSAVHEVPMMESKSSAPVKVIRSLGDMVIRGDYVDANARSSYGLEPVKIPGDHTSVVSQYKLVAQEVRSMFLKKHAEVALGGAHGWHIRTNLQRLRMVIPQHAADEVYVEPDY